MDLQSLQRELNNQTRDSTVHGILQQHARLSKSGRPEVCTPSAAELAGRRHRKQGANADGKVIFPNWLHAQRAAVKLEALFGTRQVPYECRRSRHGHVHLKTARQPLPEQDGRS